MQMGRSGFACAANQSYQLTAFYFLSAGWVINLFMPEGSASSILFVIGAIVLALVVGLRK